MAQQEGKHTKGQLKSSLHFLCMESLCKTSQGAQMVKNLPAMQLAQVFSLGWEDPPGDENGNPLQYPCLENSMDKGAWWAIVYEVTKSQIRLRN